MMENDNTYSYLLDILSQADNRREVAEILAVLLSDKERQDIVNRLKIFALLEKGMTQREISATLGVGIATVSRGAKVFKTQAVAQTLPAIENCLNK